MDKKIISNTPGETKCDSQSIAEYHPESGWAVIKRIKSDKILVSSYFSYDSTITYEEGFCFVNFTFSGSGHQISRTYTFESSIVDGKRKIMTYMTGLIPETSYDDVRMYFHMIVPNGAHKVYYQAVPKFQTLAAPVAPTLITKIQSVDSTSVTIDCTTNPGSDEIGEPYKFLSKIVLHYKDNPLAAFSNSVPSSRKEQTTTIKLDGLVPNQKYDKIWASVLTNYNFGKGYLFADDKIRIFTTENVETTAPSFTEKDLSVKDNDLTINYILDLGSDQNGDPYQLESNIELYDQDDKLLDSKSDSTGTFNIEDLANGEYSGWYLSAKTSYDLKAISAVLDDFTIKASQIVAPSFSEKDLSIKDNDLTINYILDLGSDQNGVPYQLEADVELYDQDDNLLDSKSDSTGTFNIKDLESGEYSGWYLSAKTSYGLKAITAELDDFTIEASQIVIPSFSEKNLSIKDNDLTINYILDLGSDQNGVPYQLEADVELYDQDGNLLDSKSDSTGIFNIKDLESGKYRGWYLSAKTSYALEKIIAKLRPFIIRNSCSNIKPPHFKCNEIKVCQDLVEVSYKINSEKKQNGEEYELIGWVVLIDDIGCVRACCDKTEGNLIADNLISNTTYSGWSIEAYTTYSAEAVNQSLDDFTTTSKKR